MADKLRSYQKVSKGRSMDANGSSRALIFEISLQTMETSTHMTS